MPDSVMIAMSGGVDSAVAAALLKDASRAAGVTMRHCSFLPDKDITDAAALCLALGIPHYVADLADEFKEKVISPFVRAYEKGLTPNPCIFCNREIKFGSLLCFARKCGFETLATGHYARVEKSPSGRMLLRRAVDESKDQTYMLYTLSQDALASVFFPLGNYRKSEVREMAAELGLEAAERTDSQDICFVPDGDYAAFIKRHTGKESEEGNFLSTDGRVLGRHKGLVHYTVGQRKGLGIALGAPAYVVSKSAIDNTVTLGKNEDLFVTRLVANRINLIAEEGFTGSRLLTAKTRYSHSAAKARVERTGTDELTVEFEAPQRAIAAGQALVLYEGDYVFGGGTIL